MAARKRVSGSAPPIHVDEEFRLSIPPLSPAERAGLEAALLRSGRCLLPLIVWAGHGAILDGHNRFAICTKHGLDYDVKEMDLPDREAALAWMKQHQRDRRNLSRDGLSYMRGSLYLVRKRARGRPANGSSEPLEKMCHADTFSAYGNGGGAEERCHADAFSRKTAQRVALEFGASPRTVLRDARYAAAVDVLTENCGEHVRELALSWGAPLTRPQVFKLTRLEPEEQKTLVELVRQHGRAALAGGDDESAPQTITFPLDNYQAMAHKLLDRLGTAGFTQALKVMEAVLAEQGRSTTEGEPS